MSIIDPLTCGFAKVAAYEVVNIKSLQPFQYEPSMTFQSRLLQQQIRQYELIFHDTINLFKVSFDTHRRNFPTIKEQLTSIGKRKSDIKKQILDKFSSKQWALLDHEEKLKHSFSNCKGCTQNLELCSVLKFFPANSLLFKKKAQRIHMDHFNLSTPDRNNAITEARKIYKEADDKFRTQFPLIPLANAQTLLPELQLIRKPTNIETKKAKRDQARICKNIIEEHRSETAVQR